MPHPPLAECYLLLGACATLGFAFVVKVFATGYFGLINHVMCAVVALRESESNTGRMNKSGCPVTVGVGQNKVISVWLNHSH